VSFSLSAKEPLILLRCLFGFSFRSPALETFELLKALLVTIV
jgi:hypothetical protein